MEEDNLTKLACDEDVGTTGFRRGWFTANATQGAGAGIASRLSGGGGVGFPVMSLVSSLPSVDVGDHSSVRHPWLLHVQAARFSCMKKMMKP
nr:hypothetical protein Iba_chr03aCG2850 [Ipomoea batatas]